MKHQVINLPEYHEHYPYLWQSECGTYRIIRCSDDIQYIFQRWREPKWRHLSYHVEYDSLVRRWANEAALPRELSYVLNSAHAKPNHPNLLNHHSRCTVSQGLRDCCTQCGGKANLRWSAEGFHSFRQSAEGLAPMGIQTMLNTGDPNQKFQCKESGMQGVFALR